MGNIITVSDMREIIARALYEEPRIDGSKINPEWGRLPEERRIFWLRDADRVIAAVNAAGAGDAPHIFAQTLGEKPNKYQCAIEVHQNIDGKYQLSIRDENGGYRLCGPKFTGNERLILSRQLSDEDCRQVSTYISVSGIPQ